MSRSFRLWLARKLAPTEFDELEQLRYLRRHLSELHWWCGEFPDIAAATTWLLANVRERFGEEASRVRIEFGPWRNTISDFREQLRHRRDA